jgi:hypothetical protein
MTTARWHFLYRHFDIEGVLLYVGISDSLTARTRVHASSSLWSPFIYRVTVAPDGYSTRDLALAAERKSIRAENPVFNRRHSATGLDTAISYLTEHGALEKRGLTTPRVRDRTQLTDDGKALVEWMKNKERNV